MSALRREAGLGTVVATSTGLPFAALEYLAAASLIAYVAGDSAWIAIGVAGGLTLLSAAMFSELNGLYPSAAAIRIYIGRAISDGSGLAITFTYLTTITLVIAADAYIVGRAITYTLGHDEWVAVVYIVVILALAAGANMRGVRIAGLLEIGATAIVITGTAAICLMALGAGGFDLDRPLNPFGDGRGGADFIQAVALGVFLYSAFEWVTANAEEVRDPARTIPKGMFISLGILFLAASLIAVTMSNALSGSQLDLPYPQLFVGEVAAGDAGLWAMMVITALTAVNTFNGGFVTASRFLYATAREGSLPERFASLNRFAVPWFGVVVLASISALLAIAIALSEQWKVVVATGAALEAGIFTVAAVCVYRLRKRAPGEDRPFRVPGGRVTAALTALVFAVLALGAGLTVEDEFNPAPLLIIAGLAVVSVTYVRTRVPALRARHAERMAAAAEARRARRRKKVAT